MVEVLGKELNGWTVFERQEEILDECELSSLPDDLVWVRDDTHRIPLTRDDLMSIYYMIKHMVNHEDVRNVVHMQDKVHGVPADVILERSREILEEYEELEGQNWMEEVEAAVENWAYFHRDLICKEEV